ncbi:MAG: Gfo/Idh/MocA family oxidoreductase [Clostridia bacterium]|nr:Gfo/Idh/MocA family oxidoreductase [Clostridia bacterium]
MMKIGLVGCGAISGIYLQKLTGTFTNVTITAVADLNESRAREKAEQFGIPRIMTLDQMLADDGIDLILNLTTPRSHYSINKKALLAGKHVYVEKPLALTYAEGKELIEIAQSKGLYVGCAPDTFLGAGIQTCIDLIQKGAIGKPVGGATFMLCHGHELWHPDPAFYYDFGGGPLFDMGPYYVTALVRMLGRAESVVSYCGRTYETRTSGKGESIPVKVDTHDVGLIRFACGAIVSVTTSFDVWHQSMPKFHLFGTEGTLKVPDPNSFGGPVELAARDQADFHTVDLITPYAENSRGIGVSELALACEEKRVNNASGYLALHVLEIMESIIRSNAEHREIVLESSPSELVPMDWSAPVGQLKTK